LIITTKRMGEEGLRWFVATVEDINDPLKIGRVRVRVVNEHDDPSITTNDLLWATPIIPITSASANGVGRSPTGLLPGSHVFGFYLDGHEKQLPMLWGSYAKLPDGTQATNDIPTLAREINNLVKNPVGPEPATPYAAKYPFNHVWKTQSGHVFEADDTPANERIQVYHKSGTYVEINKDGQMVTKVVDKDFEIIVKDKTVYVGGNCNIQVVGSATINVGGSLNATIGGSATMKAASWNVTGNMTLNGSLTSTGDVVAAGISLDKHTHGGVQSGGSRTTPPS
jgi:phage baseplate assembly protein V